jgi:hypothetical protein
MIRKNITTFSHFILLFIIVNCQNSFKNQSQIQADDDTPEKEVERKVNREKSYINPRGMTIETRILVPDGYERVTLTGSSFGAYLRQLPLKPDGARVMTYDGRPKKEEGVYCAVADKPIGNKNLHQCADAVIRLRAEYFYERGEYDNIHFNFTNGMRVDYTEWMKGKRLSIKGNTSYWYQATKPLNTPETFWKYLEIIFSYAGSMSLSKELVPVEIEEMKVGDVFIRGGFPGHAMQVADMAENRETGKRIFLLIQSYMPAQEIQVVINPNNKKLNPWYSTDFGDKLATPEWDFYRNQLMRFEKKP